MPRFRPGYRTSSDLLFGVSHRAFLGTCRVCGESLRNHDVQKCGEKWLKAEDAKGNPSNTRRK